MKTRILILLLLTSVLIFAEDIIPEKKIKFYETPNYEMFDKLQYSGISSTVTVSGQRGYYNIAIGFAEIGKFKSALKYAKKIEKQREKDDCYFRIVIEMIAEGLYDDAIKATKKFKEERYIRQSFSKIIRTVINENHDYDKAMQYATNYQDDHDIKLTKGWIIRDMLINDQIEAAKELYKMNIPDSEEKRNIFDTVASTYLYQDDFEGLLYFMKITNIPLDNINIQVIVRNALRLDKINLIKAENVKRCWTLQ